MILIFTKKFFTPIIIMICAILVISMVIVTVRFDMQTSAVSEGSHSADLLITKAGNYWVIKSASMDDFLKRLTGFA